MSDYDKDIEKFSDHEKVVKKYAIEQVVTLAEKTHGIRFHECMLCRRYKNEDSKGIIVHIVKSHYEILKLIHQTR